MGVDFSMDDDLSMNTGQCADHHGSDGLHDKEEYSKGHSDEYTRDILTGKILSSTCVYSGSFLAVDAVDVELPNGHKVIHDVVRHPGAVAIIALDAQGRVLIVHQYRTALERVTREIPAGKLDAGEEALECAKRELAEETGYRAGKIRYLAPIALAAGYSDEIIHLFMATDLKPGFAKPDEDEFVACEWVALDELIDEVLDGKLEDSKTVIAVLLCDAISRRLLS